MRGRTQTAVEPSDPIDIQVGLTLRRLRRMRGFSQAQIGKALGLSFQQIQKYEAGKNRIAASTLVKVTHVLDISINQLLSLEDSAPRFVRRYSAVRGAEEMLELYCALPQAAYRSAVLQVMRVMHGAGRSGAQSSPAAPKTPAAPKMLVRGAEELVGHYRGLTRTDQRRHPPVGPYHASPGRRSAIHGLKAAMAAPGNGETRAAL